MTASTKPTTTTKTTETLPSINTKQGPASTKTGTKTQDLLPPINGEPEFAPTQLTSERNPVVVYSSSGYSPSVAPKETTGAAQNTCPLGLIPMRSAAFQAPRIPLPALCQHLLPDGDVEEEETGVQFRFKPQANCRTEVTFTIEPKPQPPWLTMLNCGFKPMVNCSAPPCYLSPNGNPGMDFCGGTQSFVNRAFGCQAQYVGFANYPTLEQIMGTFPGGKVVDPGDVSDESESTGSSDEDTEEIRKRHSFNPFGDTQDPEKRKTLPARKSSPPGVARKSSHPLPQPRQSQQPRQSNVPRHSQLRQSQFPRPSHFQHPGHPLHHLRHSQAHHYPGHFHHHGHDHRLSKSTSDAEVESMLSRSSDWHK